METDPEPLPDAPDPLWPSGPWTGFYLEDGHHPQDLQLEFRAGRLSGDGHDGIGPFLVEGRYDEESLVVVWTKQYLRGHAVAYRGFREREGIWGTWRIGDHTGGFHIWPVGSGEGGPAASRHAEHPRRRTTRVG